MYDVINSDIKKILIIKLRGIGDVILSTVIFDNLKENFPNTQIDFLTEKPSLPVFLNLEQISKIHLFPKAGLLNFINIIRHIRNEKYDLILDLYSNPKTAQLTFLSGARFRAGFPYRGRKYAYNLFGPSNRGKHHSADLHLEFLKVLGLKAISNHLYFGLKNEDKVFAKNTLAEIKKNNKLMVCLSPSGGWPSKKCDPVKFAEIGKKIRQEFNCELIILWGPGDLNEAEEIKKELKDEIMLAPPTTLGQMAAILSECDAVIANDSGPMHISTAVGTPTISLHGPTHPWLQGAYGEKHEHVRMDDLDCIGCNLLECNRDHECFLELPVSLVIEKFTKLLKKNNLVVQR